MFGFPWTVPRSAGSVQILCSVCQISMVKHAAFVHRYVNAVPRIAKGSAMMTGCNAAQKSVGAAHVPGRRWRRLPDIIPCTKNPAIAGRDFYSVSTDQTLTTGPSAGSRYLHRTPIPGAPRSSPRVRGFPAARNGHSERNRWGFWVSQIQHRYLLFEA